MDTQIVLSSSAVQIFDPLKQNTRFYKYKKLIPFYFAQEFSAHELELTLVVNGDLLVDVLFFLKHHINSQYSLLSCVTGIDSNSNFGYRYQISYDLLSLTYNTRIRVKTVVDTDLKVSPSAVGVFINANWWEREVWDMFSIFFFYHPELRRILTDYGFEGSPLDKNFFVFGYLELIYDYKKKKTNYNFSQLIQEYRSFFLDRNILAEDVIDSNIIPSLYLDNFIDSFPKHHYLSSLASERFLLTQRHNETLLLEDMPKLKKSISISINN